MTSCAVAAAVLDGLTRDELISVIVEVWKCSDEVLSEMAAERGPVH